MYDRKLNWSATNNDKEEYINYTRYLLTQTYHLPAIYADVLIDSYDFDTHFAECADSCSLFSDNSIVAKDICLDAINDISIPEQIRTQLDVQFWLVQDLDELSALLSRMQQRINRIRSVSPQAVPSTALREL